MLSRESREMYEEFMAEWPCCMMCGWGDGRRREFRYWMIPRLDNAHIIGGSGRRHDRRCIVRLCAGCHRLSHGDKIKVDGRALPNFGLGEMLWLKRERDVDYFDLEYLAGLKIGALPDIVEPHTWFIEQWNMRNLWGRDGSRRSSR